MNLRTTFLWNILIGACGLVSLFMLYKLFNLQMDVNKFWDRYESAEVGTDKELESKIQELEQKLEVRDQFKFKMVNNPTNLSRVIEIEGLESFFGIGSGRINVNGILSSNDTYKALIQFKNKTYYVQKGDTLAGGRIDSITQTNLVFVKDGEEFIYDLSIK